jgi:uncharacterized protein (TIGR02284 family)
MKRDDAINTLYELFKVCKHNQHRYEVAAAASTDSHLAALLEHYALRREQFALHLADVARIMGAYPDTSSGMSPTQASILFDLESPLKPENEWVALAACERGEAQARAAHFGASIRADQDCLRVHLESKRRCQRLYQAHREIQERKSWRNPSAIPR